MIDEPYRWLDAIANRREYIRDRLKGATPVFAFSRPEGILLFGVGSGQSKVFEVYDRHALAALGHPVDIEKIRQTTIEAAHLEGFSRAPEDVTARRLLNFSLSPLLKTSFEQIFSAPLIVELVFAELGASPAEDILARITYDGTYQFETNRLVVVHTKPAEENAAEEWLRGQVRPESSLKEGAQLALAAWQPLTEGKPFTAPASPAAHELKIDGKIIELGLLDRSANTRARYRALDPASLS